jgi:hypothetical protein
MNLRFIERDGKRILQFKSSRFTDWADVPFVDEKQEQAPKMLETGSYTVGGSKTVYFDAGEALLFPHEQKNNLDCVDGVPGCNCRYS